MKLDDLNQDDQNVNRGTKGELKFEKSSIEEMRDEMPVECGARLPSGLPLFLGRKAVNVHTLHFVRAATAVPRDSHRRVR